MKDKCCKNCKRSSHIDSNVYVCSLMFLPVYADEGKGCRFYKENDDGNRNGCKNGKDA